MRCVHALGFAAVAVFVGATAASAAASAVPHGIATTRSLAPLMSQKFTMSKSALARKIQKDNGLRQEASALSASGMGIAAAQSQEGLGQSAAFSLRTGLTSRLTSSIATEQAVAPKSQVTGMAKESSAFALRAENLVNGAGTADRAYSFKVR